MSVLVNDEPIDRQPPLKKEYLGDAVYIENNGYFTLLTTSNGIQNTNIIVLEPPVLAKLIDYAARVLGEDRR
jgi:hypothetical protein